MKILVNFLNGNDYWHQKVIASAEKASAVLSNPAFIAKVRAVPSFDFTSDSPDKVADVLAAAGAIPIQVNFYRGWWWSKAIAFEDAQGVHFNTRKEAYGAGGVNNICHETLHALGYRHNGNSPIGQENTVPWLVAKMAEDFLNGHA